MNNKKITKLVSNPYFILSLIVLFGLALRMAFFSGMGTSDSLVYSRAAYEAGNGQLKGQLIEENSILTLTTRIGIIYAAAFSYMLFGINDISSVIFILAASMGGIILIYFFGKLLFNEKVGLVAALLLSFFPLDLVYSTQLLSDIPSAFFMALGVYTFLYAERYEKRGLYYFFSGIFIGVGYIIRESALLIALFFLSYIAYKRKIKKKYFFVPIGVIIVLVLESAMFFSLTGDPLFRQHASQKYLESAFIEGGFLGRLDFPLGLLHYPWMFATNNLLRFFYLFVLGGLVYVIFSRKKEAYTLVLWLIPLLFYLSFGSAGLTHYLPFKAADRYTSIVTMPAILLVSFFFLDNKKLRKLAIPSILALLVISIATVYAREDRNQMEYLKGAYVFLKAADKERFKEIFIDSRSLLAVEYISKYDNKLNVKSYPKSFNGINDAYVVVNKKMIRGLKELRKGEGIPDETDNIPDKWILVSEFGKINKDKVMIYYIQ